MLKTDRMGLERRKQEEEYRKVTKLWLAVASGVSDALPRCTPFMANQRRYNDKVIESQKVTQEVSYETVAVHTKEACAALGIRYTEDPYWRFSNMLIARILGEMELRRPDPSTKSFDANAMLMAAGRPRGSTSYSLPRGRVTPLCRLRQQVLPWLPRELEAVRR